MPDVNNPCLACSIVRGTVCPPGGVVWRGEGLVVHGLVDPSPIAGWLVVTSERHVRALDDLNPGELAALGSVAARVIRAQKRALGAEHTYAFAIGDLLRHFHLHLVPRYASTPDRLRGRRCFDMQPGDALPVDIVEEAAERVRRAIGDA